MAHAYRFQWTYRKSRTAIKATCRYGPATSFWCERLQPARCRTRFTPCSTNWERASTWLRRQCDEAVIALYRRAERRSGFALSTSALPPRRSRHGRHRIGRMLEGNTRASTPYRRDGCGDPDNYSCGRFHYDTALRGNGKVVDRAGAAAPDGCLDPAPEYAERQRNG